MLLSKKTVLIKDTTPKKSIFRIGRFIAEFQLRNQFQKDKKQVGKWMRDEMIDLGPAFIKIGQFMSTRIDVFGKDITTYLAELQDQIYPIPFDLLEFVLHQEYGGDYKQIFSSIDPIPIASASIGQVHRGFLKKSNQDIVLKIQKPGIENQIKDDLKTLISINKLFSKFGFQQAKDFEAILNQYESFLSSELNYINEAKHMAYFRRKLIDQRVYIPKPLSQSTQKVLVMEYVESIKINNIEEINRRNINRKELARDLVTVFLYQIINLGHVHCDPHPGNLGIGKNGEIVLFDFGNVVVLSKEFREKVNRLVFSIYQKDIDEFLELLIQLKILQLEDNFDILELKAFFNYFFDYLETLNFDQLKTAILNKDIFVNNTFKIKIDPNFLSLFRLFSLIDGTCSLLDQNFNYISNLAPFSDNLFMDSEFIDYRIKKDLQKIQSYPKLLKSTDQNILRVNRRFIKMNDQLNKFKFLFIFIAVMNDIEDPVKLGFLFPMLLFFFWKEKK
uniref:ABC1 atypical kinase-like domain-containing protein n=1 Tax=viral metagenome TaxID=1070528 RepID=A0A6C0CSI7_9ZZZZ